jgi:hypothetical protein
MELNRFRKQFTGIIEDAYALAQAIVDTVRADNSTTTTIIRIDSMGSLRCDGVVWPHWARRALSLWSIPDCAARLRTLPSTVPTTAGAGNGR